MVANVYTDGADYRQVYDGIDSELGRGMRLPGFRSRQECRAGFPPSWFLGPRAENVALFEELIADAIASNVNYRQSFHPEDGPAIRERIKQDPKYLDAVDMLRTKFAELLASLRHDTTPYYSWRYQGHMLWDTTLPSLLGYFATMLHNPNNVTVQASTLTTFLEQIVGWDLCSMLGFPFPDLDAEESPDEIVPHGHLTSGGTVANIEATWSARELKYLPVAVQGMLRTSDSPLYWYSDVCKAKITVRPAGAAPKPILDAAEWELLNVPMDSVLTLPSQIHALGPPKLPGDLGQLRWRVRDVWELLLSKSVNGLGLAGFYEEWLHKEWITPIGGPVILAPVTMHYSWPKALALLGGGALPATVMPVNVDYRGRMDIRDLDRQLHRAHAARNPVLLVVAVLGSTEESAVDDVAGMLKIRDRMRRDLGFDFNIHVDAAWGGYFASMLRKEFHTPGTVAHPDDAGATGSVSRYVDPNAFEYHRSDDPDPGSWVAFPSDLQDDSAPETEPDSLVEAVTEVVARIGGSIEGLVRGRHGTADPHARYPVFVSKHVGDQLLALQRVDSATVDPHKTGYVPYPAGAICYRNGEIRRLVTFGAPVIGSGDSAVSVGEFGVEGSKPGAAASAVYLSHAVVRPTHDGYGRLMNASLVNTRLFYAGLLQLNREQHHFISVPLTDLVRPDASTWSGGPQHLHADYAGWLRDADDDRALGSIEELSETARRALVDVWGQPGSRLPPDAHRWLSDVGPDLNIVDYMFNFRRTDGEVNRDLRLLNIFNLAVYDALHVPAGEIKAGRVWREVEIHHLPILVSKTEIYRDTYGDDFVFPFLQRLGIERFGPSRQRFVDIVQRRDPPLCDPEDSAEPESRVDGERELDCYRKAVVMRSVIMDPFLHARNAMGELYVDEWMDIVQDVVAELAVRFRDHSSEYRHLYCGD